MTRRRHCLLAVAITALLATALALSWPARDLGAQGHAGHGAHAPASTSPAPATGSDPPPRRVSRHEIHVAGGVPRGWRFALPGGDAARGRQVFADLECYKCHEVKNGGFPPAGGDEKSVGPELTGMGTYHPAEYFAESILSPNAVVLDGKGFVGPDGRSVMPSFADSLTVPQLLDLVAYLKSLTGDHAGHHGPGVERVTVAGDYRVRLLYQAAHAGHDHADHSGHKGHAGHGESTAPGVLMAFVEERESGERVPYLTVSATVHVTGQPARTLKLVPRFGDLGFHYGVTTALSPKTQRVRVSIGAAAMQVTPSLKGRFAKPVTAVFDWQAPAR